MSKRNPNRMPTRLAVPMSQAPREALGEYMKSMAHHLMGLLPPVPGGGKCAFFLILTEPSELDAPDEDGPPDTNYVSNCRREDAVRMLRETADRLEKGLTNETY